jgi:hypothetical protein
VTFMDKSARKSLRSLTLPPDDGKRSR